MLRIPAEAQKGTPRHVATDDARVRRRCWKRPERERRGRVFKLLASGGTPMPLERTIVGKIVSAIGKAAGVVVDERQRGGKTVASLPALTTCGGRSASDGPPR